jgi:hypothetical protein
MRLSREEWEILNSIKETAEKRGFIFNYTDESHITIEKIHVIKLENLSIRDVNQFLIGYDKGYAEGYHRGVADIDYARKVKEK